MEYTIIGNGGNRSSRRSRKSSRYSDMDDEDSTNNRGVLLGLLLLLFVAAGLYYYYYIYLPNKEDNENNENTSTTGSSVGTSKTDFQREAESDSTTNKPFLNVRDKLKNYYLSENTNPIITDDEKKTLLKQFDYLIKLNTGNKPSQELEDEDIYKKSLYNISASIDVRNETINSTDAVNMFSNQLDILNGKENIDYVNLDKMTYEKCSNDMEVVDGLLDTKVCKLDKLPAIENFTLYNTLLINYKNNRRFSADEKKNAVDLIHKAIKFSGFNIDLREKINSCSDLIIYSMLITNNVPEIINMIPSEFYLDENEDSRFFGYTHPGLIKFKCLGKYNDWTNSKSSGRPEIKDFTLSNDEIKKCKLAPLPPQYTNDHNYNKIMQKYKTFGEWDDNERNTAIVITANYYRELKKIDGNLPDPQLQGRSNFELYNMLKANNKFDFYNATNRYYMTGGIKDIDWKYTSDSFDCANNWTYISSSGEDKGTATNYTTDKDDSQLWCKIKKTND